MSICLLLSASHALTLLRHKSLLTSGAWLNFFQDGGILFAISLLAIQVQYLRSHNPHAKYFIKN